ncbi:hypothetical protein PVAR5_7619 [Paecilomyces variotii No. 5]|uniref:Monooxygenase n=1 Tax=Byssochlamys spectabilis (strain No. 5 / NBRC 109023) TaxID=1356009 RepID=V5GA70_BYSSN|nr:hypothetical protein PVAR5_7619 [Paecilomyces variotii No. 5]
MSQVIFTSIPSVRIHIGQKRKLLSDLGHRFTDIISYVSSSEIQTYLKAVVLHYGLDEYIQYNSKVEHAVWCEQRSQWSVSVEGKGALECDVLVNAGGILNNPKFPDLKNLGDFKGELAHTAAWNDTINAKDKRVAIVGAGASAIQTLPEMQPIASHVDMYIRTPSWITGPFGSQLEGEQNYAYTEEERARFRDDPEYSLRVRKSMETSFTGMHRAFFKGSDEQKEWRTKLEKHMRELIHSEHLQQKLIPSFEAGCRRTSPGERYLAVLQKDNVEPIFTPIQEVTPSGIRDSTGVERPVDIIIAATGFDTSFRPRFPIVGREGIDLRDLWKDEPDSYCGLAVSGFPNYLVFLGPNTPIANGSLIGALEATADYFIRLLRKMTAQRVASFDIRSDVQSDFNSHTQDFMRHMVWTGSCRSWYKNSTGKITAVWPGSGLHYREFLESDRWEDWNWHYKKNRFQYWGQGLSTVETSGDKDKDLSYYIRLHPNLPQDALDRVARSNQTFSDSETDESPEEQILRRLVSSPGAGAESSQASDISWDDDSAARKVSGTAQLIPEIVHSVDELDICSPHRKH